MIKLISFKHVFLSICLGLTYTNVMAEQNQTQGPLSLIKGYPQTLNFQNRQKALPLLFNQSINLKEVSCEYRGENLCPNGKLSFPKISSETRVDVQIKFKNIAIDIRPISLVLGNKQTLIFRPLLFPKQMAKTISLTGIPLNAEISSANNQSFQKTEGGWKFNLTVLNSSAITIGLFQENAKMWEAIVIANEAKKVLMPKLIRARSKSGGEEVIQIENFAQTIESISSYDEAFWDMAPLRPFPWGTFKQNDGQLALLVNWDALNGDQQINTIIAVAGEGIEQAVKIDIGLFDDNISLSPSEMAININSGQAYSSQSIIPNLFNSKLRKITGIDFNSDNIFYPANDRVKVINSSQANLTLQYHLISRPENQGTYSELLVITFDNGDHIEIPVTVQITRVPNHKKLKLSLYLPVDSGLYINAVKNLIQAQNAMNNIIAPIVVDLDEVANPIDADTFDYSNATYAKKLEDNFDIKSEGFPVWYFPKVKEDEGREVGGFTYLAAKKAMTFIAVSANTRVTTLTHELGHALGLPHTFEYTENPTIQICHQEGQVCVISEEEIKLTGKLISPETIATPWGSYLFPGDGISDTPFDPGTNASFFQDKCYTETKYVRGQSSTKFLCPKNGVTIVLKGHELGKTYSPACSENVNGIECRDGRTIPPSIQNNYMSYWEGRSESGVFSPQQISLMKKNIENSALSFHKYVD